MKYAIYTVLTQIAYDTLLQPQVVSDEVDYYCFVRKGDMLQKMVGIWNIIEIECQLKDEIRLSRFPKILPQETILKRYDFTLYIDANILIKTDYVYHRIDELIRSNTSIALLKHPFRDCAYQELYVCLAAGKGQWWAHIYQILYMKLHRYPAHAGLYEANLIFRRNCQEVFEINNAWWRYYNKFSCRDQASFMLALWQNKCNPDLFLDDGYTTRNHSGFEKENHLTKPKTRSVVGRLLKMITPISRKILKH